jgi:uncharacterized repeat protein (TIGR01451 family)
MKKLILLFLVLVLKFAPAKAQWVTIPDPNFVTKLTQLYPSCMNGNQMDTTSSQIVISETVDLQGSNISNLFGIQYFDNLTILNCSYNQLTSLPALPNSLTQLTCFYNQLSSLPNLPNSLTHLNCYNNQLSSLPNLPSSLIILFCYFNQLSSLPTLPNSLTNLQCNNNQLSSLPTLPHTLIILRCYNNLLSSLPALPNSLTTLLCYNNLLSSLPVLPNSLTNLQCNDNQLQSISSVPSTMNIFNINNNNISCMVNLPSVANATSSGILNNPLSCVPNQTNYSLGLPLCLENDFVNNPNNCQVVNISGKVYKDLNENCAYNSTDLSSLNIPVKLYDNQNNYIAQSYTLNGVYTFSTFFLDTFQVKIDTTNLPILMACGQNSTQNVVLDSANQTLQNINFSVVCNAAYDVLVQSVTPQGWVFPGQTHTLETNVANNSNWFNLNCTSTNISGTVSIQINGPVFAIFPATGALTPTFNGNTFTYNISNLNNLNPDSLGLRLVTDTTAQANDQICVHVEISTNPVDADTTNNVYDFCYNVVNSYDPNMKEVYPVNVLPGYEDWFTYTIHFQNTGNAPAFNIRLRDTLDTQLDLNTFEVLGYSHPANVGVSGNILSVRFNNIMLPDSTTDYEESMGYFQYRLKPLPNLPNGSQISNTAYIYFDYNAPIVTNTTANNFEFPVKLSSILSSENSFSLFPNPSTGVFTFKDTKNLNTVEVYSILGEKILSQTNQKSINLSGFSKGVYFARVNGGVVLKMVKE